MNNELESKINKIKKINKMIYVIFFIISTMMFLLSFFLHNDIAFVLKPMSFALALMIILHYYINKLK